MLRAALLSLTLASTALAQAPVSTMCQSETIQVFPTMNDRRLIGCGEGFPDNLLWHLDRSDTASGTLDQKVRLRLTGRGVVVYLLDSGVLRDHEEFQRATGSNIIGGIDADQSSDCPVTAPCARTTTEVIIWGHGTATASVLAGKRTGVAPDASIVAVRTVMSDDGAWARALQMVITHAYAPTTPAFRTAIISMSFAPGINSSPQFEAVMRRMIEGVDAAGNPDPNGKKFLFVVLGGNNAPERAGMRGHCTLTNEVAIFPSLIAPQIDGLISVGGITRENTQWEGACQGTGIEILAPAADMLVASNTGTDRYRAEPVLISGTSYATPYVAGMAARLLEADPTLTPAQLEQRLKASVSVVDGKPVPVMLPEGALKKRRSVR